MGCLFILIAGFFPRVALAVYWIARPAVFQAVFGSFLWPLLGLIFLPFTTLMYVLLWTPGIGLTGLDWLWLAIAFFLDIGHNAAGVYSNRERVPGYTGT